MPTKKLRKKAREPRKDRLMRRFADTLGQDELAEVLTHAADPRAHRLMAMLLDPAFQGHSFSTLCSRVGLNLVDLLDLMRRCKLDQGIIEMARHAPEIMGDIAKDAQSRMVCCDHCGGAGKITAGEAELDCPLCDGVGQIRAPGDDKSRRLFFKVMTTGQGPR